MPLPTLHKFAYKIGWRPCFRASMSPLRIRLMFFCTSICLSTFSFDPLFCVSLPISLLTFLLYFGHHCLICPCEFQLMLFHLTMSTLFCQTSLVWTLHQCQSMHRPISVWLNPSVGLIYRSKNSWKQKNTNKQPLKTKRPTRKKNDEAKQYPLNTKTLYNECQSETIKKIWKKQGIPNAKTYKPSIVWSSKMITALQIKTTYSEWLRTPGRTCRWWPSLPVFHLQVRRWASWFSRQGQMLLRPWIQSLLLQQGFRQTDLGKPRRRPCMPKFGPNPLLALWKWLQDR